MSRLERKTNVELLRFLVQAFGVPRRMVTLVRGEAGRRNTLRIASPGGPVRLDWAKLGGSWPRIRQGVYTFIAPQTIRATARCGASMGGTTPCGEHPWDALSLSL